MPRSEEAILRRALKRNRTEEEQRHADRIHWNRQTLEQRRNHETEFETKKRLQVSKHSAHNRKEDRMLGITSSYATNSINTTTGRCIPNLSKMPRKKQNNPRHDVETSKKLVWARQSDSKTISRNKELRELFRQTGGKGMDTEDVERAKVLLARDHRKQERKKRNMNKTAGVTNKKLTESSDTAKKESDSLSNKKEVLAQEEIKQRDGNLESTKKGRKSTEAQSQRDQNKALRVLYLKTGGKGMEEDQIKRAKLLFVRIKKKHQRRSEK